MNAKELRIGNWYDSPVNGEFEFDQDAWQYFDSNMLFNVIEPIPLTKEWLERLGFEPNIWKDGLKEFYKGWAKDGFMIETVGKYYVLDGKTKPIIKYVHQLQNLYFALTGEELTIKE